MRRLPAVLLLAPIAAALAACSTGDGGDTGGGAAAESTAVVATAAAPPTSVAPEDAAAACLDASRPFASAPVGEAAVDGALVAMDACADAALLLGSSGFTAEALAVQDWTVALQTARVQAMDSGATTDVSSAFETFEAALSSVTG